MGHSLSRMSLFSRNELVEWERLDYQRRIIGSCPWLLFGTTPVCTAFCGRCYRANWSCPIALARESRGCSWYCEPGVDGGNFDFGNPILTEARSKKRASLHIVKGREALTALDPQGLEILEADQQEFAAHLVMRNHTLKRALTDPCLFSGIGNAYSDEILHHAKLSPIAQT